MKFVNRVFFAFVCGMMFVFPAWSQLAFPRAELSIGIYRIKTDVAATPQTRERGLMFRESMPQNEGMVFVFPRAERHCMWMRNTLLPLAVAFLDNQGLIVNIEEMEPQTEVNHCAHKPVKYALEMNSGWFKDRGFKPGTQLSGLGSLDKGY